MDIWDFVAPSGINTTLDKDDCTLEELFNEPDVVQEVRVQNEKLIKFLCKPECIEKMVKCVLPFPGGVGDEVEYKLPFLSCEILCAGCEDIEAAVWKDEQALQQLATALAGSPDIRNHLTDYYCKVIETLCTANPSKACEWLLGSGHGLIRNAVEYLWQPSCRRLLASLLKLPLHIPSGGELMKLNLEELALRLAHTVTQHAVSDADEKEVELSEGAREVLSACIKRWEADASFKPGRAKPSAPPPASSLAPLRDLSERKSEGDLITSDSSPSPVAHPSENAFFAICRCVREGRAGDVLVKGVSKSLQAWQQSQKPHDLKTSAPSCSVLAEALKHVCVSRLGRQSWSSPTFSGYTGARYGTPESALWHNVSPLVVQATSLPFVKTVCHAVSKCYEKSAPASPATARKAGGGVVVTVRLGSSSVHLFQLLEAMSTAMCMASWGKDVSGPAVSELLRTAKEALEYVADHSLAGVHVRHSILNIIRYCSPHFAAVAILNGPRHLLHVVAEALEGPWSPLRPHAVIIANAILARCGTDGTFQQAIKRTKDIDLVQRSKALAKCNAINSQLFGGIPPDPRKTGSKPLQVDEVPEAAPLDDEEESH